jgi:hypothetical protein
MKKKHRFACTLRFSTGANQVAHISLARRTHTVAAGKPQLRKGNAILRFTRTRPLPRGDYALTVRWSNNAETWATESTIRVD